MFSKACLALKALQLTFFPTVLFVPRSAVALPFIYEDAPVAEVPHSCIWLLCITQYPQVRKHGRSFCGQGGLPRSRERIDDAKLVRALVGSTNSDPAEHDGRGVIDKVWRDCVRNVNCGGMW